MHDIPPPHTCKCKHLTHSCMPPGWTVHAKWSTVEPHRNTQTGILFGYAPYEYSKMRMYQNVTPVIKICSHSVFHEWFQSCDRIFSHKDTQIAKLKVYYNLALLYLLWVNSKQLECTLKILIFSHKFNEGLCTFCQKKLA